jgi:hypothetical protein
LFHLYYIVIYINHLCNALKSPLSDFILITKPVQLHCNILCFFLLHSSVLSSGHEITFRERPFVEMATTLNGNKGEMYEDLKKINCQYYRKL